MLFEREVRVPFEEEHVVEHVLRAGDGRVHVAELQRDELVDVALVAVVVNARLGMGEAVFRRRDRAQQLVLDVDERDRLGGRDLVARDHGRDRIADEPHLVRTERVFVVAHRQDAVRDRKRSPVSTRCTPGCAAAFDVSIADDARVRMRRAQQPAVQHARQDDVVGKARLAGDFGAAVDAPAGLADDLIRSSMQQVGTVPTATSEQGSGPAHADQGQTRLQPLASTASMICA